MRQAIITLATFVLLGACDNLSTENSAAIVIDIPDTSNSTDLSTSLYKRKIKLSSELDLTKLELGKDSFQLRLWIKAERTNGGQVFAIKKSSSDNWKCLEYRYIESPDLSMNSSDYEELLTAFRIDSFEVVNKQPKSGWTEFFDSLEEQNIYELPSQTEIQGWDYRIMDGISYEIEYIDKSRYRYYWYNCPDVFENEFKECAQMTAILEIFDNQFDLGQWPSFRCKN